MPIVILMLLTMQKLRFLELDNLNGFRHLVSVKLGEANIKQEVYDFSKLYTQIFASLEIVVFVHNNNTWWQGVNIKKFTTWSRITETVLTIYSHGSKTTPSKIDYEYSGKIMVTPYLNNMICDIYIQEFYATTSI